MPTCFGDPQSSPPRWIALFACLIGSCAHDQQTSGQLPPRTALRALARTDPGTPLSYRPRSGQIAFVRGGLRFLELDSGAERKVSDRAPTALAWSPDGRFIAAALPDGAKTLLELRGRDGAITMQRHVNGTVVALHWSSPAELLALAGQLKSYSFGGNYRQLLHGVRLTGGGTSTTLLSDATVRRRTQRSFILETFHSTLAPLGDELAYARFHDPPNAAPYLSLVLRHLATGIEKVVARVGHADGRALFSADGERLLVGRGARGTQWIDPRDNSSVRAAPVIDSPGRSLGRSARGTFLLVDGRLLRGKKQIGAIPKVETVLFTRRGAALLRRTDGGLMLLSGLDEPPLAALVGSARTKLLELRRWRAKGLISTEDYLKAREGLVDR